MEEDLHLSIEVNKLSNTRAHGWLLPSETQALYKRANVFILPSYKEGFPNSLLEAMSFGLAPIVTGVGGIPDVIKDMVNGRIIEARSPGSIEKAMRGYIEDKSLLHKHAELSWVSVKQNHSVRESVNELVKIGQTTRRNEHDRHAKKQQP